MKKIVSIQDISCVGKCSLSVALPIISAMGTETAIIPTAVLSTHTAFNGFTFKDLTDQIIPITEHWKQQEIDLSAIYTGYLGSFEQIEIVKNVFENYENALKFVDPAMGDNGKLYSGFDTAFAKEMATLCAKADIIVPNITEAAFMLSEEYKEENYDENYIKNMLKKLCELGAETAIITGISLEKDKLGAMGYSKKNKKFFSYYTKKINAKFHGTGDIFSSVCVGSLMRGKGIEESIAIAADFTAESIRLTTEDKKPCWYGVNFEQAIPYLIERMK